MNKISVEHVTVLVLVAIVVIIVAIVLVSPGEVIQSSSFELKDDVSWVNISAPLGVEGPCWAYFSKAASGYQGFGYSGVYCQH